MPDRLQRPIILRLRSGKPTCLQTLGCGEIFALIFGDIIQPFRSVSHKGKWCPREMRCEAYCAEIIEDKVALFLSPAHQWLSGFHLLSSSRHCFKHIIWLWMSVKKKNICFMWSFDLKWTYYPFLYMPKAQATDRLKHLVLHISFARSRSFKWEELFLFIFDSLTGKKEILYS